MSNKGVIAVSVLMAALVGGCPFTEPPLVDGPDHARLSTTEGEIVVELFPDIAPVTVANFQQYAEDGFYDGTIFHRAAPLFVIQGGLYTPDLTAKETREPIANESRNSIPNVRGTISMAWTNDPNDAAAEFFFNVSDNPILDPTLERQGYTVFGGVVEGLSVVDAIAAVETEDIEGFPQKPVEAVVINSVTLEPGGQVLSSQWDAYFQSIEFSALNAGRDLLVDFLGLFLAGDL